MPSTRPSPDERPSRRRVLAGLGAALTVGVAGCSGRVPGTGPARIDADETVEADRLRWEYPPLEGDREGIGYAAVSVERLVRRENLPPALGIEFNSTIGGIASGEPYTGFRPDWFRFRVWPPSSYDGRLGYALRVEPPGQWEGFAAYYDIRAGVRRSTVELRNVATQGTILVPAVFDPGGSPLPDALHCAFAVRASRPGLFGKTVRVADRGTLDLDFE